MGSSIFPTGRQNTFPGVIRVVTRNKTVDDNNPFPVIDKSAIERADALKLHAHGTQTELLEAILSELKTINKHLETITDEDFPNDNNT